MAMWRSLAMSHSLKVDGEYAVVRLYAPDGRALEPRVTGRSRKRYHIADVGQARDVGKRALEPQPEARVRHRAVTPQVAIPAVGVEIEPAGGHARIEHVQPLLALAAAHDLADRR